MTTCRLAAWCFTGAMLAGPVALVACVDPAQDYNDYSARTSDAHAPPSGTGISDASADVALYAPDAGFGPTPYFMSCLSTSAEGNTSEANLFVANIQFTPSSGGGGTMSFSNQPLKVGATSLSDTVGMSYKTNPYPFPIAANGTGTANFGATVIPGAANPINGADVDFSSSALTLHVESATQICGTLVGSATVSNVPTPINGTCVLTPLPAGKPLPSYQIGDYHCP